VPSVRRGNLMEEARALCGRLRSPTKRRSKPSFEGGNVGDTLGQLDQHLLSYGITRVGDLTGLDTIRLPVFFACRPNSRSLSISQGKGLDPSRARLGAILEALEHACAERHETLISEKCSYDEMGRRGLRCIDSRAMLRCSPDDFDTSRQRSWVPGVSLRDGLDVYVPFELAGLDFRTDAGWDHHTYRMSTVGLGAGTSLAGAALQALLEVIENDATVMVDLFGLRRRLARSISYTAGHHAELDEAVARVEDAGLQCFFVKVESSIAVSTVAAFLTSPPSVVENLGMRTFVGFACRLSAEQAALAALLEAVQSRVTQMAGSRDDMTPAQYSQQPIGLTPPAGKPVRLDCISGFNSEDMATPQDQLRYILPILVEAGATEIVLVPLGAVGSDVRIVRALVTGLQSAAGNGVVRLSLAAVKAMLSAAGMPA
jgi:ribosomal protein S12 methylthiotransferase accessory factor